MSKSLNSISSSPVIEAFPNIKIPYPKKMTKKLRKSNRKMGKSVKKKKNPQTLTQFLKNYHSQSTYSDYEGMMKSKTEDWLEKYGLNPLTDNQSTLQANSTIETSRSELEIQDGRKEMLEKQLIWLLNPLMLEILLNYGQGSQNNPIILE